MNKLLKFTQICLLVVLLTGCQPEGFSLEPLSDELDKSNEAETVNIVENQLENLEGLTKLPKIVNLGVQFASQAPHGNWDLPYQEACEEAALIMAAKYFFNQDLDNDIMDQEINDLVEWEKQKFGFYTDTDLSEMEIIAREYFNLKTYIIIEPTVDEIKKQLADNKLVIAPTAGRMLGNKNYSGEGPLFHVLVLRGYDQDEFITNDPGTRNGEEFKYKYDIVMQAIHDLPQTEDGKPIRLYDIPETDETKAEMIKKGIAKILIVNK